MSTHYEGLASRQLACSRCAEGQSRWVYMPHLNHAGLHRYASRVISIEAVDKACKIRWSGMDPLTPRA